MKMIKPEFSFWNRSATAPANAMRFGYTNMHTRRLAGAVAERFQKAVEESNDRFKNELFNGSQSFDEGPPLNMGDLLEMQDRLNERPRCPSEFRVIEEPMLGTTITRIVKMKTKRGPRRMRTLRVYRKPNECVAIDGTIIVSPRFARAMRNLKLDN